MLRAIREIQPSWIVGENVLGLTNWDGGVVFREVLSDMENEGYEVQPFIIPACSVNAPHRRDRIWIIAKNTRSERRGNGEYEKQRSIGNERKFMSRSKERNIIRENEDAVEPKKTGCKQSGMQEWKNGIFEIEVITDSDNIRLQRRIHPKKRKAELHTVKLDARDYERRTWDNFPTESPLRTRDDGFPGGLDGITISKLQTESIKAAGNAIVPQVAFQIFKAIEQCDATKSKL